MMVVLVLYAICQSCEYQDVKDNNKKRKRAIYLKDCVSSLTIMDEIATTSVK